MRVRMFLVLMALLPMSAVAEHCESWSTSQPEVDAGAYGYYVDYDPPCQMEAVCEGVFVYEETNGAPGLQRGDEHIDDTCHAAIAADALVFA